MCIGVDGIIVAPRSSLSHHLASAINCRHKYRDPKRRFHDEDKTDAAVTATAEEDKEEESVGNNIPWLEQSLQLKVKKLEEEREEKPDLEDERKLERSENDGCDHVSHKDLLKIQAPTANKTDLLSPRNGLFHSYEPVYVLEVDGKVSRKAEYYETTTIISVRQVLDIMLGKENGLLQMMKRQRFSKDWRFKYKQTLRTRLFKGGGSGQKKSGQKEGSRRVC